MKETVAMVTHFLKLSEKINVIVCYFPTLSTLGKHLVELCSCSDLGVILTYRSENSSVFCVNSEKGEFTPPTFKPSSTIVHCSIFIQVTRTILYRKFTAFLGFERKKKKYALTVHKCLTMLVICN